MYNTGKKSVCAFKPLENLNIPPKSSVRTYITQRYLLYYTLILIMYTRRVPNIITVI